jgi:type IV pilus assembly protein PilE
MVTVAIIGILVAIAIPNYQNHLRKGRRADAQAFMMDVANRQQQYLLDARTYATTLAQLNATPPTSATNFYSFAITTAARRPLHHHGTPTAGTAQASDGALVLDSTGTKTRADPGKRDRAVVAIALRPSRHGGFSLVELMTVVAIVAILAAIAAPNMGAMIPHPAREDGELRRLREPHARPQRGREAQCFRHHGAGERADWQTAGTSPTPTAT